MASTKRLFGSGLVAAAILTLAACSSTATAAPGSSSAAGGGGGLVLPSGLDFPSGLLGGGGTASINASTVLSADVAAQIIGGSPTLQPGSMTLGPISLASYGTDSGDSVSVYVETIPGGVSAALLQAAITSAGNSGDMTPVSGIGDAAGKVIDDHEATVAFAKNGTIVVVSATVAAQAGSDLEPKVEAVAQQIAGKL